MDLAAWIPVLNLVHVLAVLAFVLFHGASGLAALRIRGERDRDRIQALVGFSRWTLVWGWLALAIILFGGIVSGIAGAWWTSGRLWIWASLAIFIGIALAMTPLASGYMDSVRHAVGLPSIQDARKKRDPPPPANDDELAAIVDSRRPIWAAVIGVGGLAVLTWLMMDKPF